MDDKQVLAIAESVARSTEYPAVREAMLAAARLLREKAATERLNRYALLGCLAVFAVAVAVMFAALARF